MKNNQLGISMVQVVIAAGMAGALALGIVRLQQNAQKSQNTVMKNYESLQIITAAQSAMRHKASCEATIVGLSLNDDIPSIKRVNANAEQEVITVGQTYSSNGKGGEVTVTDIAFARDADGNLEYNDTEVVQIQSDPLQKLVTIPIAITIDKRVPNARDGAQGYGAQTVVRRLPPMSFVIEGNDIETGQIIECQSSQDEFLQAAMQAVCVTSLGGSLQDDGRCIDLTVNRVIAEDAFELENCLTIESDVGPGPEGPVGAMYKTGGGCVKNFLVGFPGIGNGIEDSTNGHFSAVGGLWTREGRITLGFNNEFSSDTDATISNNNTNGLVYFVPGTRTHTFTGNVNLNDQLAVTGDVTLNNQLTVSGATQINNTLNVTQASTLAALTASGPSSLGNTTTNDLTVQGSLSVGNLSVTNLTASGDIQAGGNINAGGTVSAASDIRLKRDMSPLTASLEKILRVDTISFNWIDQENLGSQREIGVKAQQLQTLFPELVVANEQGYLFVNYQGLVAPTIKAIQEQQAQIDKLQAELEVLKEMIKNRP